MTTFVGLLRAVNVGSTNRIAMAELRAALVDAGFVDVATHIQTGNVLLTSPGCAASVKRDVEAAIHRHFGLRITAVIRTDAQLAAIAAANPFIERGETEIAKLYVAFLDGTPSATARTVFAQSQIGDDEVIVSGSQVYVRYAVGAGTTKLTASVWKRLGVESTARNWKVTTALADLAAGHQRRS